MTHEEKDALLNGFLNDLLIKKTIKTKLTTMDKNLAIITSMLMTVIFSYFIIYFLSI